MSNGLDLYINKLLKGQHVPLDLEGLQNLLDHVNSSDLPKEDKEKFENIMCERDRKRSHHGLGTFDAFKIYLK